MASGPSEGRDTGGSPTSFETAREPPARAPETPVSSTGTDNKYVVWSSAPSDVPRTGPDDR
jgi:hypothetical protein